MATAIPYDVPMPPATPWSRIAIVAFAAAMVLAVALRLLAIPAGDRLIVHDEIMIGPQVVNSALMFGMSYENWEFPNYLLALLNGMDGAIGALIRVFTQDWRVAKLVQYAVALSCVTAGFWHASGRLAREAPGAGEGETGALRAVATACYLLSPYSLTQMNNGTFWSFTVYFAMAFVPLILLLLCMLAAGAGTVRLRFALGLFAGVCSWWLPLVAVLACSALLLPFLLVSWPRMGRLPEGAVAFAAGLAVGGLPVLLTSYYTLVDPGYDVDFKMQANATYGIIQGGILTPLMQRFSWILYVGWDTKAVHSFFADFDSVWVRISYVASLAMLIYAVLGAQMRSACARLLVALLLVFAAAIFFAKGASFPFGNLFVALIDSFAGFGVVRTPDTKFGMAATASLMLAWVAAGGANLVARRGLIIVGGAYLSVAVPLFFSGALIDPAGPARYRVTLSADEQNAIRIVNESPGPGRVLIFPGSGTGTYPYERYAYVGRNFLTPNVDRPVVSVHQGIVGEKRSVQSARLFVERMDLPSLRLMGIRFVIVDKTKEYGRYRDFAAAVDGTAMRTLTDGAQVALFELLGPEVAFEAVDGRGSALPATLSRSDLWPAGFIVAVHLQPAIPPPLEFRVDVAASSHWRWLYLGPAGSSTWKQAWSLLMSGLAPGRAPTSVVQFSKVGLAQWTVTMPTTGSAQTARWLVVHVPNVLLFLAMALCLLLALTCVLLAAARVVRGVGAAVPVLPIGGSP
jgi:hypothetical protein